MLIVLRRCAAAPPWAGFWPLDSPAQKVIRFEFEKRSRNLAGMPYTASSDT
jgi:hypothetical protein